MAIGCATWIYEASAVGKESSIDRIYTRVSFLPPSAQLSFTLSSQRSGAPTACSIQRRRPLTYDAQIRGEPCVGAQLHELVSPKTKGSASPREPTPDSRSPLPISEAEDSEGHQNSYRLVRFSTASLQRSVKQCRGCGFIVVSSFTIQGSQLHCRGLERSIPQPAKQRPWLSVAASSSPGVLPRRAGGTRGQESGAPGDVSKKAHRHAWSLVRLLRWRSWRHPLAIRLSGPLLSGRMVFRQAVLSSYLDTDRIIA
ncbi:hypothetical protein BOTBODRAFT_393542 [Botryobasidium botryosum FD-172 SS1]|uniref:Uncharacterized protein n=1 Tax=Botryobasidium botryosum (strain FD-172 SS1) TaxID=930990 RepID=A0A067N9A6_BOTB1|nr:hypothetical protein BOTBODRAFT_393542 [Botryobasidium botryosum FD-172 SS1]